MPPILARLRLRTTVAFAAGLLAAVGIGTRQPAVPAPDAARGSAADAEVLEIVPDLGLADPPRVVERAGAVERVILGSLRAEVSSGRAALAGDRFAFAILGAVRTPSGWLFVSADGAVARSASFLGPLDRFGEVPRPAPGVRVPLLSPTCGRLAIGVADPRASLWTSDGTRPMALAPGAPAGVVLAAAFADRDHGMIVLDGGELFATRDGAASFERVDLGSSAASAVACVQGELRVTTSQGALRFAPGQPGEPMHGRPVLDGAAPSTEPLRAPIMAAALRRYGALVAGPLGGIVADDGRVLLPHDHALAPLASASTAALAAASSGRGCSAERWGDRYALLCMDGRCRRWSSSPLAVAGRPRHVDPEPSNERALDKDGRTHFLRINVDARLQVTPDGELRFAWRGFDWQGAYGERRSSGRLAMPRAREYVLERTTREGAVMLTRGDPDRVIWLPAGRPPVTIADDLLDSEGRRPRVEDLLTLPDGTLALLFGSLLARDDAEYHRLLQVDPQGQVIAQRTLYWDNDWRSNLKNAGIAIVDGALGVEWAPRDTRFPRWFFAIDATRPRREVASDPTTAVLCRPGAQGALTVEVGWGDDHRFFLRGGRAGAAMCEQAVEIGRGLDPEVFAVVSPYGDQRTTAYMGEVRTFRWVESTGSRCREPRPPGASANHRW